MKRRNPTCGHCGSGTIADGLSYECIYYKCTRTGCRSLVIFIPRKTHTESPCLTEYRNGSCQHKST